MADFLNKLIKFPKTNIIIKTNLCLYKTENSQILLCQDLKNKTNYCLKVSFSQINNAYQISTINTEIYLLQKMKNEENIVQIIDFTTMTQYNFIFYLILLEYCQYQTLYDLIKQNFNDRQILDDSQIYSYIYQIALGIKSLHKNGYCHRDLCLENILFKEKDKLVICDFGSATNQFFPSAVDNNNLTANLLIEIEHKSKLFYRAPEEIIIYSNYPLSEKVDIYSLGIILFMMLLSYVPSLKEKYRYFSLLTSKRIKFEIFNEIKTLCNPFFSELLGNLTQRDPSKRYNIDEVIAFLFAKESQISKYKMEYNKDKNMFSEYFDKTLYEYEKQEINKNIYNISILVKKLLENDIFKNDISIDVPNKSYIDMIINKINNEPRKIIKFYQSLFNTNVFFYNIYSIKMIYIMHHFIYNFSNNKIDSNIKNTFINSIDLIWPNNFDISSLLQNLINYYTIKINNNYFDKLEIIKNMQVNKFILLYCQFIRNKMILLKKYSLLISNDNTINTINCYKILTQNFVFELFNLYISIYQILSSIPFNENIIIKIVDLNIYLLNQEMVSLCSILLTQIIALLKLNKKPNFLEQFIDITLKVSYFFQKLKNFRKQIDSKYEIIYFLNAKNPDKKLKDLLNYIKNIEYDESFNVNEFFEPNSNLRKQLSYIPVKIIKFDPEGNKSDFPLLNNNQINNKNNLKDNANKKIKNNECNKINNNINNNIINNNKNAINDLIVDMKNININNKTVNNNIINNFNQNNKENIQNIKNECVEKLNSNSNNDISNLIDDSTKNNNINMTGESKAEPNMTEEILSFLKNEFSKPIFQFIIQQNSIKTLNLIGRGGTSMVYLGNYRGTDVVIKKIKVKEINDNYFKEFKNEIVTLTMIRHPNLVYFMGTMIEDNNLCIVTEYCKGGTLFDLLYKKKNINLSWNLRLRLLIDISRAMNYLHTNDPQIIHFDLKSLNILLTDEIKENSENDNVTIKISDFGLSKIIDKEKIEWEATEGIVGSVQWMAPEVIQNNCIDNTKADIYSFGIIIWEVCTRIQPFKDMNSEDIINFVINENGRPDCNLLPLNQMPKGLLDLIENCWNTEPNLRPDFSMILYTLIKMQSLDE